MLLEIKKLLDERSRMSLRELAVHFRMEPEAVEPMLDLLIRKGQAKRLGAACGSDKPACAGCTCANREDLIVYAGPSVDDD